MQMIHQSTPRFDAWPPPLYNGPQGWGGPPPPLSYRYGTNPWHHGYNNPVPPPPNFPPYMNGGLRPNHFSPAYASYQPQPQHTINVPNVQLNQPRQVDPTSQPVQAAPDILPVPKQPQTSPDDDTLAEALFGSGSFYGGSDSSQTNELFPPSQASATQLPVPQGERLFGIDGGAESYMWGSGTSMNVFPSQVPFNSEQVWSKSHFPSDRLNIPFSETTTSRALEYGHSESSKSA
ncbi:hypothetical protein AAF712_014916 [Marasmius tenuissimus]|uniref:Uncharacterized protein n=1 Tax=Marasmius tenuissimus TaxID=585030 RepID=A0ABR2ZAL5_9AGAR